MSLEAQELEHTPLYLFAHGDGWRAAAAAAIVMLVRVLSLEVDPSFDTVSDHIALDDVVFTL